MEILGHNTGASLSAQHVSGAGGRLGATVEPTLVEWNGWEVWPHPYPVYQRGDPYRLRAYCLRLFLFKCAWRDESAWHLPAPSGVYRWVNAGGQEALPDERPWKTHGWPGGVDNEDNGWQLTTAAHDFTLDGQRIYQLASDRYGGCLDVLIPPLVHHDLAIVGRAWRRVAKRPAGKETLPANRKLEIKASVCRVDAQEEPAA